MIYKTKLKNQIQVVGEALSYVHSVSVGVYVRNGSMDEDSMTNGMAHFIEHMLFKGTQNTSARMLADRMSRIGGHINAYTSKEHVCYYGHVLDEHLTELLDLLAEMLSSSLFDSKEIEKEKAIILDEYTMYEDTPEEHIMDVLHGEIWKGHPLSYNIVGEPEQIQAIERQSLLDYFHKFYSGENIVISIVGNVDFQRLIPYMEKIFSPICSRPAPTRQVLTSYKTMRTFVKKDIEQIHLAISFPCLPCSTEDKYVLDVLNTLLGDGLNSRLFQHIRETRGLAYSIYSYVETFEKAGLFTIYAATNPRQADPLYEAIEEELILFLEQGVSEDEWIKAQEEIKSDLIINMESIGSKMSHYGKEALLESHIETVEDMLARLQQIDRIKIQKMAQRIFLAESASVCVIGKKEPLFLKKDHGLRLNQAMR